MGIKQIVTDDLTGETLPDGSAATTVTVDGKDYSVYLSEDSVENFLAFLSGELPLSPATRPAAARSTRSRSGNKDADRNKVVREWAQSSGFKYTGADGKDRTLGDRGAIPQAVYDAYDAAN